MKTFMRWALPVLILISLACTVNIGGPTPPAPPPTIDPTALDSLKAAWTAAIAAAPVNGGHVTVSITEPQLAALIASKLADDPDAFFQQPQVLLRDNQIQIFGVARQSNIEAHVRMVVTVTVDDEGVPQFQMASADFGPWPVPEGLLDGLSEMLNEALTGKIVPSATGFRLESITIENGQMTIQGTMH